MTEICASSSGKFQTIRLTNTPMTTTTTLQVSQRHRHFPEFANTLFFHLQNFRQRFCPPTTNSSRGQQLPYCYMNLRTEPHFRQATKIYQFLMNMTNALMLNGSVIKLPTNVGAVSKSCSRQCTPTPTPIVVVVVRNRFSKDKPSS